ncbi:MAG TPA: hypothetical protein VE732_08820 [Nitrososphaera sp.]|nr:hypothetical protein [Nitrososphaera sp.]
MPLSSNYSSLVGSSLKNLREFPEAVKDEIGFALYEAQCGFKPLDAKPLKDFGSANVLEIVLTRQTLIALSIQ